MDAILTGLNEHQRCAVTSPASVVQVLAPPGSGKTKTLTARVAYLIAHEHLLPWNIIVCTFTIKAAREMKERIRALVGDSLENKLILGTFHSVARRFLVTYGHLVGISKSFGIADSADSLAIFKRIVKRRGVHIEPSVARARTSALKARSISCAQYAASLKPSEKQEFASLYTEYEEVLEASNLLDYDDLLLRCADLLRHHPQYVSNVEAVLIDEFQDTNNVQYDLMCLFAQHQKKITIVGDPDQSIYGFRSAEIKNLKRMQQQYPETVVIILEENYRSSGSILLSALEVIEQDETRPAKKLLATHCAGVSPVLRRLPSSHDEATWIVMEIQRCRALTGHLLNYSDVAILLRSASLSRHIETILGRAGIPYRMVGGHRFFDRIEVKTILDYLRVINQPDHNDALIRIINVPSRKIGELTVKTLLEEAEAEKKSLWSFVLEVSRGDRRPKAKMTTQGQRGLEAFTNIIETSRRKLSFEEGSQYSLIDIVDDVLEKLSYKEYLRRVYPEDFEARWANVEELMAQASDMSAALARGDVLEEALPALDGVEQRQLSTSENMLGSFLANVALSTEAQRADATSESVEQVTISTIHAAKGLEWPVVFIPSAYGGSIPHSRAEDTDEERRLLYVGMTRAQALLYLSYPLRNSQREQTTLSPFLAQRSMARFFDLRGPSLRYSVTQDLARILRRACPLETFIQSCSAHIERSEDDLWPLDGEVKDIESSDWNSYDNSSDSFAFDHPVKRRRVDVKAAVSNHTTPLLTISQAIYSISTTTIGSGFVSAGKRMQELKELEATSTRPSKDGENQSQRSWGTSQEQASTKRTLKKHLAGQGSLLSFFGKPSSSAPARTSPTIVTENSSAENSEIHERARASKQQVPARLHSTSNAQGADALPVAPSISQYLTARRVRENTKTGRPSKISHEDEAESKPHILMSSSPVHPDAENRNPDTVAHRALPTDDFRPAASFHTTSIAQCRDQTQQQRKTLGTRRSLQGWSARPNRPFAIPKRPQ